MIIKKKKESDFTVIGQKTRDRIRGLIDKKLTLQTIALFASEYEIYDVITRLEIIEYINFLMGQELDLFLSNMSNTEQNSNVSYVRRKKEEFEEKQKNIRKIQELLAKEEPKMNQKAFQGKKEIKLESLAPQKLDKKAKKAEKKASKESVTESIAKLIRDAESKERKQRELDLLEINNLQKQSDIESAQRELKRSQRAASKTQSKPTTSKTEKKISVNKVEKKSAIPSSIDKLIREAEEREKKQIAIDKELEIKRERQIELEKIAKEKQIKADLKKSKANSVETVKKDTTKTAKNKNDYAADVIKRQKYLMEQKEKEAKEYAQRETEKEKLWQQLYGKSRKQSILERSKAEEPAIEIKVGDKIPSFETISKLEFVLDTDIIKVIEIVDPSSRMYIFWNNIKKKHKINNIFVFLDKLEPVLQKKLAKKRKKFILKVGSLANTGGSKPK